ncbi:hypothetical protein MUO79_00620 [Candidatus Bathyarchaeota archaeon]|jgi:hypothetical protein|nr:hypothetical protein [Candidatus Bathyarchaeota archaeon]
MTLRGTVTASIVVNLVLLLAALMYPILLWIQYFSSLLTLGLIVLWIRDLEEELDKKKGST